MPVLEFPDPKEATPEGIIGVGGDLHEDSLVLAYRQGIFPWPIDGIGLAWFSPDPRAILAFSDLHISRSLKKTQKKTIYSFSINKAFERVIRACAKQPRKDQDGTWITHELYRAYLSFQRLGYAHSIEVWDGNELVGGIYGVGVEGVFSAESMFHLKPNASKLALLYLIDYLRDKGLNWMDIQVMTPHMKHLGAKEISRRDFFQMLKKTQKKNLKLFP